MLKNSAAQIHGRRWRYMAVVSCMRAGYGAVVLFMAAVSNRAWPTKVMRL
jgi:hypothetical protein